MKFVLVPVAAIALAIAGFVTYQKRHDPTSLDKTTELATLSDSRSVPDQRTSALQSSPSASTVVAASPMPSERILKAYNAAAGGRAFVFEAMNRPGEGGRYYASRLAQACSGVEELLARTTTSDSSNGAMQKARADAEAQLRSRCGDFSEKELAELLAASADTSASSDGLIAASRAVSTSAWRGTEEGRRATLDALLATGDPVLLDEIGLRIAQYPNATLIVEGKSYAISDPTALTAFYLAPCRIGLDCTARSDPLLAVHCFATGACYQDRNEKALKEMVSGDSAKLQEAQKLASVIAEAVKRRDANAFMRR